MATKSHNSAIEELLENLTIKQFIDLLPGHFFVKNKEGEFVVSNLAKGPKPLYAEGKTDFEMPWKEEAKQLRENDKKVMESKKEMIFMEKLRPEGKEFVTFASVKAPLLDKNGNVLGIIGHAVEINEKR